MSHIKTPSSEILKKVETLQTTAPYRLHSARINWFEPLEIGQWVLYDSENKFHLTQVTKINPKGTAKTTSGHVFTPHVEIKWISTKKIKGEDSCLFDIDRSLDCHAELLKEDALNAKIGKLNSLQFKICNLNPEEDELLIDELLLLLP